MTKSYMIIVVNLRKKEAVNVQKILTEWGCLIRIRLGLHEGVLDQCSDVGSIILELVGERDKHIELARKLNLLSGVKAQYIEIPVEM